MRCVRTGGQYRCQSAEATVGRQVIHYRCSTDVEAVGVRQIGLRLSSACADWQSRGLAAVCGWSDRRTTGDVSLRTTSRRNRD